MLKISVFGALKVKLTLSFFKTRLLTLLSAEIARSVVFPVGTAHKLTLNEYSPTSGSFKVTNLFFELVFIRPRLSVVFVLGV
ncbi:hypothetical protein ATW68_10465 [Oenococcus oeni]|nr:hypothetical protein ATW68_10465 [Oenococcus oeni]